jgi:hypothetical protein
LDRNRLLCGDAARGQVGSSRAAIAPLYHQLVVMREPAGPELADHAARDAIAAV